MHSQASGHAGGSTGPTVTATMVESVPDGARVRDYDQLTPRAMAAFPSIVDTGRRTVSRPTARGLESGEIINFTGYYRVEIEE